MRDSDPQGSGQVKEYSYEIMLVRKNYDDENGHSFVIKRIKIFEDSFSGLSSRLYTEPCKCQ